MLLVRTPDETKTDKGNAVNATYATKFSFDKVSVFK